MNRYKTGNTLHQGRFYGEQQSALFNHERIGHARKGWFNLINTYQEAYLTKKFH